MKLRDIKAQSPAIAAAVDRLIAAGYDKRSIKEAFASVIDRVGVLAASTPAPDVAEQIIQADKIRRGEAVA